MTREDWKKALNSFLTTVLVLIGLALVFNTQIRNAFMLSNTNKYTINKVTKEQIELNKTKTSADDAVTFDFDNVQSLSTEMVVQAQMQPAPPLPVIGGIAIPELDLNLPIFKGLDNIALTYGAGTMEEGQVMGEGNYALASHHIFDMMNADKMLFSPLRRAEAGQKIYLTDKGKVYVYKITEKFVVTPDRVDVLDYVGKTEITLITCEDADAKERIVVKGEFVESFDYETADKSIHDAFNKSYNLIF